MNPPTARPPVLLTREELAERWRVQPDTLSKWRQRGRIPVPVMLGDLPRWRVRDIEAYEARNLARPAAAPRLLSSGQPPSPEQEAV